MDDRPETSKIEKCPDPFCAIREEIKNCTVTKQKI